MRLRYLLPLALLGIATWSCKSQTPSEPTEPPPELAFEIGVGEGEPAGEPQAGEPAVLEVEGMAIEVQPAQPVAEPVVQPPPQQPGLTLQGEADKLQLLHQRRAELVNRYLAVGDDRLEQADLQGALEQYAQALELDPGSATARSQMRKVQALMGDQYGQAADHMQDAAEREMVRQAQARMAAEQATIEGDAALRDKDWDLALKKYREAEVILRFNPLIGGQTLDEKVVANKIETASKLAGEARSAEQKRQEDTAKAARAKAETEARHYREHQLLQIYTDAYKAFQAENYALSEQLANQVLVVDPHNSDAQQMVEVSQAARHKKVDETTLRKMREEWLKTFEDLDSLTTPQPGSVVFDDLERWKLVSQRTPPVFTPGDPGAESEKAAVVRRLSEVMIQPKFGQDGQGASLASIAEFLQTVTGVTFLISPKLREVDPETTAISLQTGERSVLSVLELIREVNEQVRWKIEDGVVKFVTADEMKGGQVLKMYEVNDLIRPVNDFPGRDINVIPSNGLEKSDEKAEEHEALVVTQDNLDALIRANVAPESWDADPANSLKISNGTLIVNQAPEVHAKIDKLLADLREATGIMVDIQARFLKVEDNFLEDIGVDFKGLGAPGKGSDVNFNDFGDASAQTDLGKEIGQDTSVGAFYDDGLDGSLLARVENLYDSELGNANFKGTGGLSFQWTFLNDLELELILRAVSKSERVQLVTAPRVLVFNTARANLTVLNQVAYVRDYDVEIAQGASIADPIIDIVQDGVILDVKPVVHADRRFITLEVRPTVAELKRPIPQLATSLGSQTAVTIMLPELEISRVRTTLPIPDGGTILLGGFKVHEAKDLRSGVPILSQIPILSFLFERKGNYVSNRKLLILLKANIVIPSEHEPTPAQLGILPGPPNPQ